MSSDTGTTGVRIAFTTVMVRDWSSVHLSPSPSGAVLLEPMAQPEPLVGDKPPSSYLLSVCIATHTDLP